MEGVGFECLKYVAGDITRTASGEMRGRAARRMLRNPWQDRCGFRCTLTYVCMPSNCSNRDCTYSIESRRRILHAAVQGGGRMCRPDCPSIRRADGRGGGRGG